MHLAKQRVGRRVWHGAYWWPQDLQGAIPRGWCCGCGTELFLRGRVFCPACEKEAQRNVYK